MLRIFVDTRALRSLGAALVSLCLSLSCAGPQTAAQRPEKTLRVAWPIDNEHSIGGYTVKEVGDPVVERGPAGPALCFGGEQDGVIFPVNPLDAQLAFTIEVLIQPQAGGAAKQQFLHLQDSDEESRVLLETRLGPGGRWFLHSFVRAGEEELELETPSALRSANAWHWVALTYADGQLRQYVDGKADSNGSVALPPMKSGGMSLGTRLNLESYFKGCVRELRFATAALRPSELARYVPGDKVAQ